MDKEIIIGFDVRHVTSHPIAWTLSRRQQYLIKPSVALPRSVDPIVWPSAVPEEDPRRYWNVLLNEPTDYEPNQVAIAFTLVEFGDVRVIYSILEGFLVFAPPKPNWLRLGYDVADQGFISGLSNCGFSPNEIHDIRIAFEEKINDYGLIDSCCHGKEFLNFTNCRVPEHAPFYLFGIYVIPPQIKD